MKHILFLILFATLSLFGKDLLIARKGAPSPYSIVITANPDDPVLPLINMAATYVQKSVETAVGAKLPIVKDTAYQERTPAIFIGNTRQLNALGFDTAKLEKPWEHHILVKNGNVYLFGRDVFYAKRAGARKGSPSYSEVGSVKATFKFLEDFVSTQFIFDCYKNRVTLPMEAVVIPDDYSYAKAPQFQYIIGRNPQTEYRYANNYFPAPWYGSYGGHSHDKAVPTAKYRQEHPEYFALLNGKRHNVDHSPQHCLSNETVRELIYQEVLEHLDKGYEMVQLSQSDGFRPCECENCRKLFGIEPTTTPADGQAFRDDPAFGEKIWIMHRDMALRLQKDRPGKKVCVLAYGPTKNPPMTFKEFPDNMMIELCSTAPEFLEKWQKVSVPAGFTVYIYNWGFYNLSGLTPKSNIQFLARQVDNFIKFGVRGIYTCGFAENGGMDGAAIYTWLKRLENPQLDPQKLLETYCRYAYLDAADEMRQFHQLISDRCAITLKYDEQDDWNDPALLSGARKPTSNAIKLLTRRYPDSIVAQLDALLTKAEARNITAEPHATIFKVLRLEMDYLKVTTHALNVYESYKINPTDASFKELADTLAARNALMDRLPMVKDGSTTGLINGYPFFSYVNRQQLRENGRLTAPIVAPLCWDISKYIEFGINPGNRVLETGGQESMLWASMKDHEIPEIWEKPLMVSATYDDKALLVKVTFPHNTWEEVAKRHLRVIVGNQGELAQYRLWGNVSNYTVQNFTAVRTKTNAMNQGKGDVYTDFTKEELKAMKAKVTVKVSGPDGGTPWALFTIPWESFPTLKHTPGSRLSFNVYSERPGQKRLDYLWAPNINMQSWRNRYDEFGTLILK